MNDSFDFLNQYSQSETPAQQDFNEEYVGLTVRADAECQVLCDGDFLFILNANQIVKEKVPVGEHILQFVSVGSPDIVIEKVVSFPEAGKSYLVIVNEFKQVLAETRNKVDANTVLTIDFTGKRDGKGTYTGLLKDGKPEGKGKVEFKDGSIYEGDFHNGWRDGEGVHTFADGDVYAGSFKDDLRTGHAVRTYKNGDVFEGEFEDGLILKKPSVFKWANGDRLECSGWDNGPHGKGTYYWKDGNKENVILCHGHDITRFEETKHGIGLLSTSTYSFPYDVVPGEAVKVLREEADRGYDVAQVKLGFCYLYGVGMERDKQEGLKWYQKAADQGNVEAQLFWGNAYKYGMFDVDMSIGDAIVWFWKASEQGDPEASQVLERLIERNGVEFINGILQEKGLCSD